MPFKSRDLRGEYSGGRDVDLNGMGSLFSYQRIE